jgi:Sulfotransferase family
VEAGSELLEVAAGDTGLDDFGDDSFREGFDRLVTSLRNEALLNAIGEYAIRDRILALLKQRLHVEAWYRRHPEIADEVIDRPLIGLGLPRTGSTALSFLLAEDPNVRVLRRFEAEEPCPPPATVERPDPRIAKTAAAIEMQQQIAPRTIAMLPSTATGPHECQDLMGLDFKAQYFQAFAYIPSYSNWLLDADLTSTYRYERRVLKLLQWGSPTRPWRLKSPTHLLYLDHLDEVFPDARFVMTHRDPTEVLVSVVDLYAEVAQMFSDEVDLKYLGALNIEQWTAGIQRALAFRERGNNTRFYDIDFKSMQRDPFEAVRGLYAWLGEPVDDAFEAGMRTWWELHAATREPNVHPDPVTFGIDLDRVRPKFAGYTARVAHWHAAETNLRT